MPVIRSEYAFVCTHVCEGTPLEVYPVGDDYLKMGFSLKESKKLLPEKCGEKHPHLELHRVVLFKHENVSILEYLLIIINKIKCLLIGHVINPEDVYGIQCIECRRVFPDDPVNHRVKYRDGLGIRLRMGEFRRWVKKRIK